MFGAKRDFIGIDLGSGWAKAVVLRFAGDGRQPEVREHAIVPAAPGENRKAYEATLRRLFRKLRSRSRNCSVAFWPKDAHFRLFDRGTPEEARALARMTPEEVATLFHEEPGHCVSACGIVESCHEGEASTMCVAEAVPHSVLAELEAAIKKLKRRLCVVQLTPMALLNAFTSACFEIARDQPFLLADFGRERALIVAGCGGVARAARVVDFPWEQIQAAGGAIPSAVEGEGAEFMRALLRELVDVCDFLDARDQHSRLSRMHVSGALSKNAEVMKSLGDALEVECVPWNPLRSAVAADGALNEFQLLEDLSRLPVAAGVALQCGTP